MIVGLSAKAKRCVGKDVIRNTALKRLLFAAICLLLFRGALLAETPPELRIGRAGHAFDHLGAIGLQAEAAAASGLNIIYSSGFGEAGYRGLPPEKDFATLRKNVSEYSRRAKELGIELNIGYLCATSLIKLDTFDKNWSDEFRRQFKTRPAEWRQQDRKGKALASWYGGDYNPACMSNPDWRAYQHAMIRYQLEAGSDGIFFDNPTVHPQGCYCPHCMRAFAEYAAKNPGKKSSSVPAGDVEAIRRFADSHAERFLQFRSTIARDFLADMRTYARTINPHALVTCNNSLNSPGVIYSQSRMYGYNIEEMSKTEDFVVVEDMNNQPHTEANGQTIEYGPTYKLLQSISHEKPIVAVTIANSDYHTAPNLMRLAMAEAVANKASYLSWPTWPEAQRKRMIAAVRPQAEFLREHEKLLNDTTMRADVIVDFDFFNWQSTDVCKTSLIAAELTKQNIQYTVYDDLAFELTRDRALRPKAKPALVVETASSLPDGNAISVSALERSGNSIVAADQPDWLQKLRQKIGTPSIIVTGAPNVRAVVHDQDNRTIVHLYNLNVQRLSSFEDKVTPANDVKLDITAPFAVRSVNILTADASGTSGPLKFQATPEGKGTLVSTKIPRLDISAIILLEP
jgi:hypothetical protein